MNAYVRRSGMRQSLFLVPTNIPTNAYTSTQSTFFSGLQIAPIVAPNTIIESETHVGTITVQLVARGNTSSLSELQFHLTSSQPLQFCYYGLLPVRLSELGLEVSALQ